MLYFHRIGVSKGIDANKTSKSKECAVCHCWYCLNKRFKFQPNVYNRAHDLLMMSMSLSNIAILNIKGSDYCCINNGMSKNEAINVMQITDLTKKTEKLQNNLFIIIYKNGSQKFNVWGY